MNLPIPNVGVQPGPQWADNINNCLTLVDQHDHANGYGVPITPSGLNINANLTFLGNSAVALRSTNFTSQGVAIADLISLYSIAGDLYFNDSAGNIIRITQAGSVVGPAGSITGLVSPASATYVAGNQTFVWEANSNLPATMDMGSIIIRNLLVNSFGITLQAPILSNDYSLTLPAIPSVQSFMTLDAAGNMAAPWTVDSTTIQIIGNQLVAVGTSNPPLLQRTFNANGPYRVGNSVDEVMFFPKNATIQSVWIYVGTAGSAGVTEFDLKVATTSGGAYATILSTTGEIDFSAGSNIWTDSGSVVGAQAGVTKPVINTTNITAGSSLRFDLLDAQTGGQADAQITVYYTE